MAFRKTYEEIREMVGRAALDVSMARDIVRKSGFRPGGAAAGASTGPILTINPAIASGCPKVPYDFYLEGHTPAEREAYYASVRAARSGDPGALVEMRDWLTSFGFEEFIVMDGVMPLLGYDYAGEVFTFTLDTEAGCPIEVDIAPPADGFWEVYKDGDSRFAPGDLQAGQDFKFLIKSWFLSTAEGAQTSADHNLNLGGSGYPPGAYYPECPGPVTHTEDNIEVPTSPAALFVHAYRASYGPTGVSPIYPEPTLTNDHLFDNETNPEAATIGTATIASANFGVLTVLPGAVLPFPDPGSGQVTFSELPATISMYADSAWRACAEPVGDVQFSRQHYPIMRSPVWLDASLRDDTTTYRELAVYRDAPAGSEQTIDWSIAPTPPDSARERYDMAWPLFDVVAVRMGADETLPPGTYFHPYDLPSYITKWDVSGSTEARMTAVVALAAPGAVLRPVWAATREDILSGDWEYFAAGIATDDTGFFEGEWGAIPEGAVAAGEVFVGFVLEVSEEIEDLVFGVAEAQVR